MPGISPPSIAALNAGRMDVRTINKHIRNIFSEGELQEDLVIRNFRITAADGKAYETLSYNLLIGA